jgi:hypothetical protein
MLVASVAQAAPIGTLKQFRILTTNGNPKQITQGSDGNFWFTESHVNPPQTERFAPDGNPWYAELSANKIAVLQLR